jgi:transposase-like protein
MLVELSMVEQRYQAVREVLDSGATITEVAKHYGVDRQGLRR